MTETPQRSLAKVITYRALAVAATIPWTGFAAALGIHLMLLVLHYLHERAWARVPWGMNDRQK